MDKETKWIIGVIVIVEVVFWVLAFYFVLGTESNIFENQLTHLHLYLPFLNAFYEIILIVGFLPAYTITLAFVSVFLAGGFYKLLRAILGTRGIYIYAKVRTTRVVSLRHYYSKALFPALLAMSLALILIEFNHLFAFIFTDALAGPELSAGGSFMIVMSFLALPFCTLFFLIFTALNTTGIFITTKTRKGETELVMKQFGDHFLQYLKGFTGFAAIMSYVLLFLKYAAQGLLSLDSIPMMTFSIAMPFMLAMFVLPATILCERRMFSGHHSLKPTIKSLTDVTDEIDDLEQRYREKLQDLEQKLHGE